jgi:hypothetical protein
MQFSTTLLATLASAYPYLYGYGGYGGPAARIAGVGAYNPYSPLADFCYGNSNCIAGYPRGYAGGWYPGRWY